MIEKWEEFGTFSDFASAEILVGRLRAEGVPAQVENHSPVPGLYEGFRVVVPSRLAHRASWIASSSALSDAELTYYATAELDGENEDVPNGDENDA